MSVRSEPPPGSLLTISHREFVGLMASCMGMAALSIDLMLPAFPDMRSEFGLPSDSTETAWVITAFFLGLAAGQLFYGPMSDRYGRKPMLYVGLTLMVVGASMAALSPTLAAVIISRVVWGLGAAAPRSLALAMSRDVFSGELMARTMSHIMATFVLIPVLAPSLGSAVLAFAPWRTLFWIPAIAAIGVGFWARRLPETLPPERRRVTSPKALLVAVREVVRTPQTVGFAIALTCIFGIMTAYVGSSEIIIDEVFHREEQFPIIFGALALFLAAGSFLNARIIVQLGLPKVVRSAAVYLVGAASLMAVVAALSDGTPPLWLFALTMALLLPVVAVLMPNSNTAAMMPLPHVAGTAAAVLGTVSTAGGALLGSIIDGRFDGTVEPFAHGVLLYSIIAAVAVFTLGLRTLRVRDDGITTAPAPVPAED